LLVEQMQGNVSGQISIASSPSPMMLFVPIEIRKFRRTFTGVEVRVTESVYPEVMIEFRRKSLDFAIDPTPERGLGRDYKTSTLLNVEMVVAVR
jgi:LysR family transcriptional regulator of abg operon